MASAPWWTLPYQAYTYKSKNKLGGILGKIHEAIDPVKAWGGYGGVLGAAMMGPGLNSEQLFNQKILEMYPKGAELYHESPGHVGASMKAQGIKGGYGVFGSIGEPPNFITSPKKTLIQFRVPVNETKNIIPDMGYGVDPGPYFDNPYGDLLHAYPNLKGAHVAYNGTLVPPDWITSITELPVL